MDKEQALEDFLNSLKTALNNASVYFLEHPIFVKSAQDLQAKINSLLTLKSQIIIGFSPSGLYAQAKMLAKSRLHTELASFFHSRKIESLEIKNSVPYQDLVCFLTEISLPPKDIFKSGGIKNILIQKNISSFSIKALDYSSLLGSEGREAEDIWKTVFSPGLKQKTPLEMDAFTDRFIEAAGRLSPKDLIADEELQKNLKIFLEYLRGKNKDKFIDCSRQIMKLVLRNKDSIPQAALEKLSVFFNEFDVSDMADTLWEKVTQEGDFDRLRFNMFSSLMSQRQKEGFALTLRDRIKNSRSIAHKDKAVKMLKELFSCADLNLEQKAYFGKLSNLLNDVSLKEIEPSALAAGLLFDNYNLMLLNLLIRENNKSRLGLLCERIQARLEETAGKRDFSFFSRLFEIAEKRQGDQVFKIVFEPLKAKALALLEKGAFEEDDYAPAAPLLVKLEKSPLSPDYYRNKIFKEKKLMPWVLPVYFRSFPGDFPLFLDELKNTVLGLEFLKMIIDRLSETDTKEGLQALKHIFSFPNLLARIEALKAMRGMPGKDREFLRQALKINEPNIRKEALLGLADDPREAKKAAGILLSVKNRFGFRNKFIERNIDIIRECACLESARDELLLLAKEGFFWNNSLRIKARAALGEANAG